MRATVGCGWLGSDAGRPGVDFDLVGYVWPDGHQDTLHAAAAAWSNAAKSVASAGHLVPSAVAAISTQVSPEVANATRACSGMGTRIGELSAAYSSMSVACNDYAKHLDEAHSQVIDELLDLLAWIVALEAKWLPRTGT